MSPSGLTRLLTDESDLSLAELAGRKDGIACARSSAG